MLILSTDAKTQDREPKLYAGITAAHNKIRAKHHLPPLQWSSKVARHAQQWAQHLANNEGCTMKHRPRSGRHKRIYGENIFWASPVRMGNGNVKRQSISPAKIVSFWAAEEKYYNYSANRCRSGKQCGHYTQIVWRDTTRLGCGMAVCTSGAQIWVCSYNPKSNYIGQKPY